METGQQHRLDESRLQQRAPQSTLPFNPCNNGGGLHLPLEAPSVQLPALGSPFTALKPLVARIQEVEAERKATRRLGFCHLGFSKPQLGEDG